MKKIDLQEIKDIIGECLVEELISEDNWGFVRGNTTKRSGDMWARSALAHSVDWKEKLDLEETTMGIDKLDQIMSDPTLTPGVKKVKTKSLTLELDPQDFKDPTTHREIMTAITKGDLNALSNKLAQLKQQRKPGEKQIKNTIKPISPIAAPMSKISKLKY